MNRKYLILFVTLVLILMIISNGCRCPAENELSKSQIPSIVLQKANQFIVSKTGSDFFYKNISIDLTQSKAIKPNYFFVYKLFIKEKPFVNEQIRFTTDSLGNVLTQFEVAGIPDCVSDPLNCDFVVDELIARQIATENNLAKGIKDWAISFEWNAKYDKYVWRVANTTKEVKLEDHSRAEGELILIDPATAKVITKEDWRVN